jgi:NAD+ synthase
MTATQTPAHPLHLNPELTCDFLARFIREEVTKASFSKVVLGLSGGIDSALAAALAVKALGPSNVHVIGMPYKTSNPESLKHAELCAAAFGLDLAITPITPMADAYFESQPGLSPHRKGNVMARQRMIVLFDASAALNALVLGTSNKTELLLGYGTLHGDLASALNPLGDLYKTQVRQLSRHLGVPEPIISKPPSADLYEGQTDEADLGYTYEEVDRLLLALVDERLSDEQIVARGFDAAMLESVKGRIRRNHFKRKPPILPKLSARTLDKDFHYMRDWGL